MSTYAGIKALVKSDPSAKLDEETIDAAIVAQESVVAVAACTVAHDGATLRTFEMQLKASSPFTVEETLKNDHGAAETAKGLVTSLLKSRAALAHEMERLGKLYHWRETKV